MAFSELKLDAKYCIVDTSVLLPLYWGNPDMIADIKREASDSVLVLLDSLAGETEHKHDEFGGRAGMLGPSGFIQNLSALLESAGIRFEFVRLGNQMRPLVQKMIREKVHSGLSDADYSLLVPAKECPYIDVMTFDKDLATTIGKEREADAEGKILFSERSDYRLRRNATKWFLRNKLASHIPKDARIIWNVLPERTVFEIKGVAVASIDHAEEGDARVDLSSLVKKRGKNALRKERELAEQMRGCFFQWKFQETVKRPAPRKGKNSQQSRDDDSEYLGRPEMTRLARKMAKHGLDELDF